VFITQFKIQIVNNKFVREFRKKNKKSSINYGKFTYGERSGNITNKLLKEFGIEVKEKGYWFLY
jgi:hypothetical protein